VASSAMAGTQDKRMLQNLGGRVARVGVHIQHVLQQVAKFRIFAWIEGAYVVDGQSRPIFHPAALKRVLGKGIEISGLSVWVHASPNVVTQISNKSAIKIVAGGGGRKYVRGEQEAHDVADGVNIEFGASGLKLGGALRV
jgi:hypothetical protein